MWAAWGTLIEKRDYLRPDAGDGGPDAGAGDSVGHLWQAQQKGPPHHPLYLRKDSTPEPFDVENYLDTCF